MLLLRKKPRKRLSHKPITKRSERNESSLSFPSAVQVKSVLIPVIFCIVMTPGIASGCFCSFGSKLVKFTLELIEKASVRNY